MRYGILCRYSVTVASAFLELLIQERTGIMEKSRKVVKRDLTAAITALKQIPSKVIWSTPYPYLLLMPNTCLILSSPDGSTRVGRHAHGRGRHGVERRGGVQHHRHRVQSRVPAQDQGRPEGDRRGHDREVSVQYRHRHTRYDTCQVIRITRTSSYFRCIVTRIATSTAAGS
jgi:hypothetical protein